MKKLVTIIFYIILLLTLVLRSAYADEDAYNQVEIEDIDELIIDESKEPPAEKIVPIPTPILQKDKEDIVKGQKAWERFKYNTIIKRVAERYDIDPQLIYATIMTESEGDEYAFRYEPYIQDASLCMGQILISTARSLGFKENPLEMYKPDVCIDLIGKYHRRVLDEFGELTPLQLATAYNTGSPWGWPVPGHLFRFEEWYNETVRG